MGCGGCGPPSGTGKGSPRTFRVLLVMGLAALPVSALWPLFSHVTTGDWRTNTYTLLWQYDKVGFGEGYGLNRGGHNLTWGWRNARADLREWLRDLYGLTMAPAFEEYARANWVYGAGIGLSWIPVVAGLIVGRRKTWTWLFFGQFLCLVVAGLLYWIGAVVHGSAAYSVRYYYEATFAVSLVAGNGVVVWAKRCAIHAPPSIWRLFWTISSGVEPTLARIRNIVYRSRSQRRRLHARPFPRAAAARLGPGSLPVQQSRARMSLTPFRPNAARSAPGLARHPAQSGPRYSRQLAGLCVDDVRHQPLSWTATSSWRGFSSRTKFRIF